VQAAHELSVKVNLQRPMTKPMNVEPQLEVRLLGRFEIRSNGKLLPQLSPPRAVSLLGFLVVNRERPLTRTALASVLWPDEPETNARTNLRRHLHQILSLFPQHDGAPWITATTQTLQWNAASGSRVDVIEFERLAASGDSRAVSIYDGDLLAMCFDDWVIHERERLRSMFLDVTYELAVRARSNRDYAQACEYADRVLASGEWREDALRTKMAALYEMGDRPGSLAAFDSFTKELSAEMGLDVMPETRALQEGILANVVLASADHRHGAQPAVPLVGRAQELDRIMAAWQGVGRQAGTTVFVTGEAGIGKTRLLAEFAQAVDLQGGQALFGYARESEGAPYQALVDVLRAAAPYLVRDDIPDVWLSALVPLVPELLRLHPNLPEIPNIEGGKQRLHEAFARVLESLARRRPIAVVLEDLHWANADTLDAFEHLARRVGSSRIVVVATYRPEGASPGHALRELRRRLQNEHRASVVGLGPLDRDAIEMLVFQTAPDAPDARALTDTIYRHSEGNPLFVWQLLQSYCETGSLSKENVAIGEAIAARTSQLSEETRKVLDIASLVGDRFSIEELSEIGVWNESAVLRAIDVLLDLRLLRFATVPGSDFSFAHRLIRDAVSAGVTSEGRSLLHHRIATVLERTRDGEEELIASHHALAGDREAAYGGYLRAARAALAIFATGNASDLGSRARDLAGSDQERFEALLVILDSCRIDQNAIEWERNAEDVLTVATRIDSATARFEALLRYCQFLERASRRDDHRLAAERLVQAADATGQPEHRMHAFHEIGRVAMMQGRTPEAVRWFEASLEEAPPDHPRVVRTLSLLATGLLRLGEYEAALQKLEEARAIARAGASPEPASDLLTAEFALADHLEDGVAFQRLGEDHLKLASRVGSVTSFGMCLVALGRAARMRGDVAEARARYVEAADVFKKHSLRQYFSSSLIEAGEIEREAGDIESAVALWERALPLAQALDAKYSIAHCKLNLGEALLVRGDAKRALPMFEEALAICRELSDPRVICDAKIYVGSARAALGDRDVGIATMREAIAMRSEVTSGRRLAIDYCYLIDALLDADRIEEASTAASALLAIHESEPQKHPFPARVLNSLSRAAAASADRSPRGADDFRTKR
jgi:DNA-binding SARP family transcriptional activator